MNSISFYGGETAGSIGKRNLNIIREQGITQPEPEKGDTVNFCGHNEDNKGSSIGTIAVIALISAGGLGYAHKAEWIGKIGNKTIQKYMDKIAKPCYDAGTAVKDFGIKCCNKIKGIFKK